MLTRRCENCVIKERVLRTCCILVTVHFALTLLPEVVAYRHLVIQLRGYEWKNRSFLYNYIYFNFGSNNHPAIIEFARMRGVRNKNIACM